MSSMSSMTGSVVDEAVSGPETAKNEPSGRPSSEKNGSKVLPSRLRVCWRAVADHMSEPDPMIDSHLFGYDHEL